MTSMDKQPDQAAASVGPTGREQELRKRAEEVLLKKAAQSPEDLAALPPEQIQRILHEWQVHRIELEMQNEELQRSQAELNAARARYFDLYDLAPVGYCTLSESGVIMEANLTAATLWGVTRNSLVGRPFSRFVFAEDLYIYNLQRKRILETAERQTFELRMVKNDGVVFWAQLTANAAQDEGGTPVYRIALNDSPERKLLETYKEMSREVLQILNEPGDLRNSIQRILTLLKTRTGFDAVGIRLQDGDDFPYFVQNGFPEDFLLTENTLLERTEAGGVCRDKDGNVRLECTCGLVLAGRTDPANPIFTQAGSCWVNDSHPLLDLPPGEDLRFHPRHQCIHRGYASVALVPIRIKDKIVGLIQLNDRRKGRFTLDTIEILEGIGSHIGAALMHKHDEDVLRESEEKVRRKLQAILEPEGDIGTLELADIIDSQALQAMMEEFYRLTRIGIGILDVHGKVLVGVGWQNICTKFHRLHPDTLKNCIESDTELAKGIPAGATKAYRCKNNLWDIMTPIQIGGRHLGNVCLGQFFYEDESPDYAQFRAQARKYGFDEAAYLAALDSVPRWSRETVEATMAFYASLSKMISSLSYSTIKLARTLSQKDAALHQLDENRAFQDSLLETIPIPVFYKDIEGRYLGVNRACEDFFGKSKDEFKGKNVFDTHPPELARIYHAKDTELFEKQGTQIYESKIMNGEGNLHDVIFHKASLTDAHGSIIGLVGAILDITERKQAETALRLSEERLQLTLDSAQIGIWDWNIKCDTWYASPIYYSMLGYEPASGPADRREWLERIHPDDRNEIAQKIAAVLQGETRIYQYEARMRHADGSYRWHSVIGHAIEWDDQNKPSRLIGVRIDVTDRKLAEEEHKQLQSQLQQAQKMEAIGTLAGGIAHDFNNILGAILGYAEIAREDSLAGLMVANEIEEILKAGQRAKELVNQILAFSRQTETKRIPLQMATIVKEASKMLRSSLPSTIDIKLEIDSTTGLILADPTQIHQVLINLCTNAYHAMEEHGGTLSIFLKKTTLGHDELFGEPQIQAGEFAQLSIGDTGSGIAPEIQERIFDPYFTTKETGKGTGMGLAIVHGIVKSCGGFVTCRSNLDEGTIFHVYLPVIAAEALPEDKPVDPAQSGNERILLVDDEEMLAKMGKNMLEKLGYRVTARTNSIEALVLFRERTDQFDLVVTDYTMPGITGIDLARRILQIRPDMPIILCTGYSSPNLEEKARALGIKGFAMKPLAKKDFSALIRKVLDGGQPPGA